MQIRIHNTTKKDKERDKILQGPGGGSKEYFFLGNKEPKELGCEQSAGDVVCVWGGGGASESVDV
jgi:hypothetical protein